MKAVYFLTTALTAGALFAAPSQARAQDAEQVADTATQEPVFGEIIVTANKREERLSDVGMSIAAISGDRLDELGVVEPADLSKVVSGFTFAQSPYNTPIYTLRGVGFYESTLSASPTVSVYVDEVPLPFPALTTAAGLDSARVEVLKGPQGTLFGQNSTGGAINYIAAKPTDYLAAGITTSIGRFEAMTADAYVSGPISDTLRGRVAFRTEQGGAWQKNVLASDDLSSISGKETLGDKNLFQGRMLLDFEPSDTVRLSLNLNGWVDKSDTQAPQLIAIQLQTPDQPGGASDLVRAQPIIPDGNARLAAWDGAFPLQRDDSMLQAALRADIDLSDTLTLTSLSSYITYDSQAGLDVDGMGIRNLDTLARGDIESWFQELRVAYSGDGVNALVGVNYQNDDTYDSLIYDAGEASNVIGWSRDDNFSYQDVETYAVYASGDIELGGGLSALAGVRYTKSKRDYAGCTTGDAGLAAIYDFVAQLTNPGSPRINEGDCVTLTATYAPAGLIESELDEDNVSWRVGLNYKVTPDTLLYTTVSQGYKAGSYPTLAASQSPQTDPVTQEKLIAYEGGFKTSPALGVNLEGAVFYYDYTDKQLRGKIVDFLFGVEEKLVNIPKSEVYGVELQANLNPLPGLRLTANGTYLKTKIKEYTGLDSTGTERDYAGTPFPSSPKWQAFADAEYEFPVSGSADAFVGTSVTYNSSTNNSLDQDARAYIKSFTTLDLRAGVRGSEGWSVMVYGRNVTDEYYWNNVYKANDTWVRYAARPATWGIQLGYDF